MKSSLKDSILRKFITPDSNGNTLMTPIVISREKKVLYFHIAKTGGSSIAQLLRNNKMDDMVLGNKRGIHEEKVAYFEEVLEEWEEYYKFTFVRNKFDLLISLYNYDRQLNGKYSLPNHVTFEEFITNHVGVQDPIYTHWIDQYYLTYADGECMYDFVGRFENYNEDLNTVCKHLGIENTQIRTNIGNYDRSKKQEYYTEDLKQIVKDRFSDEIECFNWWY
tara:strand:+ start:9695 stop:10357 length:663 start_codon:yes stop_codon:yes gene_type:complete